MKVLHIGKFFPPHYGGIESYMLTLFSGLSGRVKQNALVANDFPKTVSEDYMGSRIVRAYSLGLLASTPICPSMPFILKKMLRDTKYDIVHLHYPNPMADLSLLLNKLSNHKIVVTYHSDVIKQKNLFRLYRPISNHVLKRSTRILVTSDNYAKSSEQLKNHLDKCSVVPLSVSVDKYSIDANRKEMIQKLKSSFKKPLILFVGRLVEYKGTEYLIRALENLDANLVIIGKGPLEEKLKNLSKELKISDKIKFIGAVSEEELINYYQACDIFCLPSISRNEAFGIVLLEAMACKKPLISTELSTGTSFVNKHNHTGFVVNPKDVKSLKDVIGKLIADNELRNKFSKNAYERLIENFTTEKMCNKTLEIYNEVINS